MITRSYKAGSMMEAFQAIQNDLGPEAIVVSVRKVAGGPAWQVWKKPYVEVVAMGTPPEKSVAQLEGINLQETPENPPVMAGEVQHKTGETSLPASTDIKTQPKNLLPIMQEFGSPAAVDARLSAYGFSKKAVTLPPSKDRSHSLDLEAFPPLAQARLHLMEQGLDEKIIQRVIKACSESLNPIHLMDEERVRHNLQKQLEAELRVQSPSATLANRVMCLVGTSGSGKTSACAKLAAFFSKIMEKKVVWICADTIRTGAIGEARMYTDALNIPLHVVYTPADLVQAIESEADAQMILVDFPACNPRSEVKVIEMGSFLTAINKRTTYFVAPATSKETDLMDMLAAFSPFNIKGLIFTKMDETSVYGNLYNIAWRSQLPLTFFANGTRIMDDLFPGQEKDLVSAIFRKGFAK